MWLDAKYAFTPVAQPRFLQEGRGSDGIQGFRTGSCKSVLVFCYKPLTTAANGFFEMRKPVVIEFDTKENLFLKF